VVNLEEVKITHKFDIVFSVSVLSTACDEDTLSIFCNTMANHLKPGGKVVLLVDNPAYNFRKGINNSLHKYGFKYENVEGLFDEGNFYQISHVAIHNCYHVHTNSCAQHTTSTLTLYPAGFMKSPSVAYHSNKCAIMIFLPTISWSFVSVVV